MEEGEMNMMLRIQDTGSINPVELAELIWFGCPVIRDVFVSEAGAVTFDCFGGPVGVRATLDYFSGSGFVITVVKERRQQ